MALGWLTRPRLRRQATLLLVVLWLGYAVDLATPGLRDRFGHLKGADFLHGYTLGSLALQHRGDALYDAAAQAAESVRRVPASAGDFFIPIYGPQVSLLYAPWALLPYGWAAMLWAALSATLYLACCYAVWRRCPNLVGEKRIVLLLALAFPGFFNLIADGQNSALALACFTGAYLALRDGRRFTAGVCIGLLIFKPQLGLVAAAVFLLSGAWRVVAGAAVAAAAELAIPAIYYGPQVLRDYAHALGRVGNAAAILEPKLYLMHSLRAFFAMLAPFGPAAVVLYGVSALAATAAVLVCWRRAAPLELRFAALLLGTVLVAPHLTVYDLVLLAPALLWTADWLLSHAAHPAHRCVRWLVYLCYVLPLFGPVAKFTHVQLSVPAFAALLATLLAVTRAQDSAAPAAPARAAAR
jgi:hypothetical protein